MAITRSQIQFRNDGRIMQDARLNNLFSDIYTNGATQYEWVEVWMLNEELTLSTTKAWLSVDPKGATVAIGLDTTNGVIGIGSSFTYNDITLLTYTTPTSKATGLTIGTMGPWTKARLGVRRMMSAATPVRPETNRLWVGGSSPI